MEIVRASETPDCESVIWFCCHEGEAPEGSPETDIATVCGAPEIVAVVSIEFPCETLPEAGFSERNTPGMTIKVNVVDWMTCPPELVPVTTIEYVPGAAMVEMETVIVEVAGEFGAIEIVFGLNETETPCGMLEAESVTEPE